MRHAARVIVIVGPTASGKSAVGLELARRLDGEIISADARQVFKYLDIGTAKPTVQERKEIRHHFVDVLRPDEPFSAGTFGIEGRRVVEEIFSRGKVPIVVGGSGLYVQSLTDGLFEGPAASSEVRRALENRLTTYGIERLVDELRRVDPAAAASIDCSKPRRLIRALEVYYVTGLPLTKHHQEKMPGINFSSMRFGLDWERKVLYERINRRCDRMVEQGFLAEVERLEAMGFTPELNALNTVGYAEVFAHRRGELTFGEMSELIKRNTRRYAKRQLTWFRRDKRIRWIPVASERDFEAACRFIEREYRAA